MNKYLSFGITKIGPVDPAITRLQAIITKEMHASKIIAGQRLLSGINNQYSTIFYSTVE